MRRYYLFLAAFLLSVFFADASGVFAQTSTHKKSKRISTKHKKTAIAKKHAKEGIKEESSKEIDREAGGEEEEANRDFYIRRAWPNEYIDPQDYLNALEQARKMPVFKRYGAKGSSTLELHEWKQIGPYNVGGRITSLATHPTDSNTFYAGAASGGLWKTSDHGKSWMSLTDTFAMLPIGAVAIDPVNPNTIYIGQGESNNSGDSYPGYGMWKSTDAGTTWKYLGLGSTQYIAKILIDPKNTNTLYVAAPGPVSLSDTNRGLYKSTDGGTTWTKVLMMKYQINRRVPVIDVAMNPLNSNEIAVFGWDRNTSNMFGTNSGIWYSSNAGSNWKRLDTMANIGLPNGVKLVRQSRGCLLWVASQNVSKLYAAFSITDTNNITHQVTDANFSGLYVATDPLSSWTQLQDSSLKIPYGIIGPDSVNLLYRQGGYNFYLAANPRNSNEIYIGGIDVHRSTDGGVSFTDITTAYSKYFTNDRTQHSDQHALAFTSAESADDLLLGSDGGVFSTKDFGKTWEQLKGLPITMFYRVEPWRPAMANLGDKITVEQLKVFGGTQDNGSVGHGFTDTTDWNWINRGDGGVAISHPTDPEKLITSIQLGRIHVKVSLDSLYPNLGHDPNGMKSDPSLKTPWREITNLLLWGPNKLTDTTEPTSFISPVVLDDKAPNELYTGRLHIYKALIDYNNPLNTKWYKWSDQLGGSTVSPKNWGYGNLDCIAIGPRDEKGRPMLWTGGYTSANLWRTVVNTSLAPNDPPTWVRVRGIPSSAVSAIVPDREDSLTAFIAMGGFGSSHVLKTTDGGKTWANISGNLPNAPMNALLIDTFAEQGNSELKNKCLIVASDVGVFVTTDGGVVWSKAGEGLPNLVVNDIKLYKNILVAGTHGRSAWAIDVSHLRAGLNGVSVTMPSQESVVIRSMVPNPVPSNTRTVSVYLDGTSNKINWGTIELIQLETGVTVLSKRIEGSQNRVDLQLPESLASGAYMVRTVINGKKSSSLNVSILH